jgi:hypothetical protein
LFVYICNVSLIKKKIDKSTNCDAYNFLHKHLCEMAETKQGIAQSWNKSLGAVNKMKELCNEVGGLESLSKELRDEVHTLNDEEPGLLSTEFCREVLSTGQDKARARRARSELLRAAAVRAKAGRLAANGTMRMPVQGRSARARHIRSRPAVE